MSGQHFQLSIHQHGVVTNPDRGELNKNIYIYISLSPFAPENLVSRDVFGLPVPRQPAHSPHSFMLYEVAYSQDPSATAMYTVNCHRFSSKYRARLLRTGGVHC